MVSKTSLLSTQSQYAFSPKWFPKVIFLPIMPKFVGKVWETLGNWKRRWTKCLSVNFCMFLIVFCSKTPNFCSFLRFFDNQRWKAPLALKSLGLTTVPVQVRPAAPENGVKSSGFTPFSCLWGKIGEKILGFLPLFSPFFRRFRGFCLYFC